MTNTKNTLTHVWVLTIEENYGTQCTGFGERQHLVAVFASKPDLMTVAPFLSKHLGDDMGQAIAKCSELLNSGSTELKEDYLYELQRIEMGKKLEYSLGDW